MRAALWIAMTAWLTAGCAKNLTEDFEALSKRACACADKDVACGRAALGELAKLLEDARRATADEPRTAAAVRELGTCLLRSGVTALELHETVNKAAINSAPPPPPPSE